MTQNHVNMMLAHYVEIKLAIIPQLGQIHLVFVNHKMELTAITVLKVGFIRHKTTILFQLLSSHLHLHIIAIQSMDYSVNNLLDQIAILQMDICVQQINI